MTATLRGLTIGDGTPYVVRQWPAALFDTAPMRTTDVSVPRRDGVIAGDDFHDGLDITIDLFVTAATAAAAESALVDLREAFGRSTEDLVLDVDLLDRSGGSVFRDYEIFGRPRGVLTAPTREYFTNGYIPARARFMATDPIRYSGEMVQVIGLAENDLPQTLPFVLGYQDSETITNTGTATVDRWSLEFEAVGGSLIDPSIAHAGTGQIIFHGLTMASGDTLVVDGHDRRAILNGTTPVIPTIAQWWQLTPGSNTIRFAASTASSLSSTATLTWRDGFV